MQKIIRSLLAAVAVAAPLAALASDLPLPIATGGSGGVYYPLGVSLAELWTANIDGVKAEARAPPEPDRGDWRQGQDHNASRCVDEPVSGGAHGGEGEARCPGLHPVAAGRGP